MVPMHRLIDIVMLHLPGSLPLHSSSISLNGEPQDVFLQPHSQSTSLITKYSSKNVYSCVKCILLISIYLLLKELVSMHYSK